MAQPDRKSAASPTIAKNVDIGVHSRLGASQHLNGAELTVWAGVINDQPASAFTATHSPLLEMYCRHVVNSRLIADELLNFNREWLADDGGLKRYDTLLRIAERESRAASSLATKLRITRQAIDKRTAARLLNNNSTGRKPWEI